MDANLNEECGAWRRKARDVQELGPGLVIRSMHNANSPSITWMRVSTFEDARSHPTPLQTRSLPLFRPRLVVLMVFRVEWRDAGEETAKCHPQVTDIGIAHDAMKMNVRLRKQ
jgi:hypothetical protein